MDDFLTSPVDGSLLLPNEQATPENIAGLAAYFPQISAVAAYMGEVVDALNAYERGYSAKILLNPVDINEMIQTIREVTLRIGGGYDADGTTYVAPESATILPDILLSLRTQQLTLCRLYRIYVESRGGVLGAVDTSAGTSDLGRGAMV